MSKKKFEGILPDGDEGFYILTPEVSEKLDLHINDILKLIHKKEEKLGVRLNLYVGMAKTNGKVSGVQFSWNPVIKKDD